MAECDDRGMRTGLTVMMMAVTVGCVRGPERHTPIAGPPVPPAGAVVVRDLTLVPPGNYSMTEHWETRGTEIREYADGRMVKSPVASWSRYTYAVDIGGPGEHADPAISVTVRRIEHGGPEPTFDSAMPAQKKEYAFDRMFRAMVGATAHASARTFSDGEGFHGLDGALDSFAKQIPDFDETMTRLNRMTYGDARLDRLFTCGLDLLSGNATSRGKGKLRELRPGDEFRSTIGRIGVDRTLTPVENRCHVLSANDMEVVVRAEWQITGSTREPDTDGKPVTYRAEVRGTATLTVLTRGGLVIRSDERVERTDESRPGSDPDVVRSTAQATEHTVFSLLKH